MSTTTETDHVRHMQAALCLARRGLGAVWPNPAVGCILVAAGPPDRVVGRGWTQPSGRPHAETQALDRAGDQARGATAYVTLEPCDHQGQTPPCSESLIAAGIGCAVVAAPDPDPRVSGRGIERLKNAGIEVITGVCEDEAVEVNTGYLMRVNHSRPMVTIKVAATLDGRIATRSGDSRWITDVTARAFAHRLRASHDAVMIGSGTAIADDPELTCRLPGLEDRSPVRVVCDGCLRLPLDSRLVFTAEEVSTWLLTIEGGDPQRLRAYRERGVEVVETPPGDTGSVDLNLALREFGRRGLTRVLVEGGAQLAAALVRHDLADRLAWFRSPRLIGGDGIPAIAELGVAQVSESKRFARTGTQDLGADGLDTYRRL